MATVNAAVLRHPKVSKLSHSSHKALKSHGIVDKISRDPEFYHTAPLRKYVIHEDEPTPNLIATSLEQKPHFNH